MREQDKRSKKLKFIILIAMSAVFIPVSYAWYDTLSNFNCKQSISSGSSDIIVHEIPDKKYNCLQQANFHWLAFYGINGMIYGIPLVAVVAKTRRSNNQVESL